MLFLLKAACLPLVGAQGVKDLYIPFCGVVLVLLQLLFLSEACCGYLGP